MPRRLATQAAAELNLVYAPSRRFTLVSGLDLKEGSIQTREVQFKSGDQSIDQVVEHTDAGLYAQASYHPFSLLSLVAGGRLDYNESHSAEFPRAGFGTLFSPRLAVVYFPDHYAFKLIYAEAFKDPADFEKFSAEEDERFPNPDLRPERTRSLELIAGWYPAGGTSVELSAYRTRYDGIVAVGQTCVESDEDGERTLPVPCPSEDPRFEIRDQFQNVLAMEVRGWSCGARSASARSRSLPI